MSSMNSSEFNGNRCHIAIEMSPRASEEVISWFVEKIRADRKDHGCQLHVYRGKSHESHTVLIVSASNDRLKVGAEIFGVRKLHADGNMREFSISDKAEFINYEDDNFITDCESLYIIKAELDSLRALHDESHIPGHPKVRLYPGKSILRKLKSSKLIRNIVCLHDPTKVDKLGASWYRSRSILSQPIDDIRNYFGDAIAIYFSFLSYYTKGLVPLVGLTLVFFAICQGCGDMQSYSILAVVNVLWATVFLEMWKRKGAEVSYKFGSYQKREWEDPRSEFHGPLGFNAITGKQEPCYPSWKRRLRMCLISFPVTSLCILTAVWLMFYYFSWDSDFALKYDDDPAISSAIIRNLPSMFYSCLVLVANMFYRILAEKLTDQENHRLESSYQNHLIIKIVLFDFVNNFLCLFYIAFIYGDMAMLTRTLRNLFLVQIVVSQTLESLVPYWQYRRRVATKPDEKESDNAISQLDMDLKKDIYLGTFDDYLEMWLQFGYVVLFSCVFPMAAVLAFVNNLVEMKSDAFKLCTAFRRPFCNPTRNIGAWQFALDVIAYLGVVSNCALIFQSEGFQKWYFDAYPSDTKLDLLILFFIVEHVLLLLRFVLSSIIPNVPENVSIKIASVQYKSQQALKKKRAASLRPTEILKHTLSAVRARAAESKENSS